jgi:hypothetical protein
MNLENTKQIKPKILRYLKLNIQKLYWCKTSSSHRQRIILDVMAEMLFSKVIFNSDA